MGLSVLSTHSAGRAAAVKVGRKPVHFSLDGCRPFCYFCRVSIHNIGLTRPDVQAGARAGGFIYALSAGENSPALVASRPASTACFPAASNAVALHGGNGIFTATPTERITHYTLLRKVVCQGASPFGFPRQQNRRYAALSGSIPPFVVSSPFHGLRVVSCKLT